VKKTLLPTFPPLFFIFHSQTTLPRPHHNILPHAHATSAHLSPPEKQTTSFTQFQTVVSAIPDVRQVNSRRSSEIFYTVVRFISDVRIFPLPPHLHYRLTP